MTFKYYEQYAIFRKNSAYLCKKWTIIEEFMLKFGGYVKS